MTTPYFGQWLSANHLHLHAQLLLLTSTPSQPLSFDFVCSSPSSSSSHFPLQSRSTPDFRFVVHQTVGLFFLPPFLYASSLSFKSPSLNLRLPTGPLISTSPSSRLPLLGELSYWVCGRRKRSTTTASTCFENRQGARESHYLALSQLCSQDHPESVHFVNLIISRVQPLLLRPANCLRQRLCLECMRLVLVSTPDTPRCDDQIIPSLVEGPAAESLPQC